MIARLISLAFLAALPASASELNVERLLTAIRSVEDWDGRDGHAGERGAYQFTRAAWEETTKLPFALARSETIARVVARKRVCKIAAGLDRLKQEALPYEIALIWNAGLSAVLRNQAKPRSIDYARRVENLYYQMQFSDNLFKEFR